MSEAPKVTVETIARMCHEAIRAYCIGLGDFSHVPWESAADDKKASSIRGVERILEGGGMDASEQHESWCQEMERQGWKFGITKNAEFKLHPALVPFNDLPSYQKKKGEVFQLIVNAMTQ